MSASRIYHARKTAYNYHGIIILNSKSSLTTSGIQYKASKTFRHTILGHKNFQACNTRTKQLSSIQYKHPKNFLANKTKTQPYNTRTQKLSAIQYDDSKTFRHATGDCDLPEYCTGDTGECPAGGNHSNDVENEEKKRGTINYHPCPPCL